ncbi:TolC family protein [Helicobacter anatolicus]|uniref:TolC family protein n=1 Tax=Helicobacter anatolicus TaxID=2905874 RepID=UPI001E64904C|nr:TolC family protein [Helicobacter anatolicus]MCE3039291.1 TolC family protein [Helicobacter anatolicus]
MRKAGRAFSKVVGVALCSAMLLAANANSLGDTNILADIKEFQKKAVKKYTLQELIKAADTNYSLQAKALATLQSKKDVTIAKLGAAMPRLDASYSFNNNARNTQMNSVYNTQTANATFKYNVFNGLADYNAIREKNANYLANVADEKYTKESVYLQVTQNYYGYFDNVSRLISLQKKLQQIKEDVKRVQQLYLQGLAPIDDLESLKAQASLSEYQIADARLSVEQNKLMLEYLTNLKVEGLLFTRIQMPQLQIQERGDLTALQEQINMQIFKNKQLNYYPVIDLTDTFTYNIQKPSFAKGSLASIYPDIQNTIGFTVSLKILDDVGLSFQKQSLKIAQLSNEKLLAYKKLEQKKDVELYKKTLEIAQKQIQSARDNLKSANIAYANKKKKYEANLITFTDYLQALSTKFDAESTFNQSVNNFEFQKANYIFYSGQKIKDYIKE